MKKSKFNFQYTLIIALMMLVMVFSCSAEEEFPGGMEEMMEEEPEGDEDTGPITTCTTAGTNAVRETDVPNPDNVGIIDDRSCYADYKESNLDGIFWGV